MAGEITSTVMVITWPTVFLYVGFTFGTPLIAAVIALVAEILIFVLTLLIYEILKPI